MENSLYSNAFCTAIFIVLLLNVAPLIASMSRLWDIIILSIIPSALRPIGEQLCSIIFFSLENSLYSSAFCTAIFIVLLLNVAPLITSMSRLWDTIILSIIPSAFRPTGELLCSMMFIKVKI